MSKLNKKNVEDLNVKGKKVLVRVDFNVPLDENFNITDVGENAKKAVAEMNDGEIVVLENTRFRGADETKNGEGFAKELGDLVDNEIFVMDAFGSAHRAHASTAGVTKFVKETAVGYLMNKEIEFLGNAVENPVRPFVAILGGAKVADKLNVISNLLEKSVFWKT